MVVIEVEIVVRVELIVVNVVVIVVNLVTKSLYWVVTKVVKVVILVAMLDKVSYREL